MKFRINQTLQLKSQGYEISYMPTYNNMLCIHYTKSSLNINPAHVFHAYIYYIYASI